MFYPSYPLLLLIFKFHCLQALLSKEEMKYLSGTSKICQTKLTRDERLVLRWGDVLNFGSKTVELGSMGDNEMCREYKGFGLISSSLLGTSLLGQLAA